MNIIEATKEMKILNNPSAASLRKTLEDDYHILVGDKNNYGYYMIAYDLFIEDGVFLIGRLSDSTKDEITISLEMAALYDDHIVEAIWSSYLSGKDIFLIDNTGIMQEAAINSGQFKLDVIKGQLKPGEIVYFNNPYTNPHVDVHPDTTVYIEDNQDAPLIGLEAVKSAADTVVNTTVTGNKNEADFTILILPNATKAPHKKFYEWLNTDNKDIPVVSETLRKKNLTYDQPYSILLYWSSNVIMASLFDHNAAAYKAANELEEAIIKYHER